MERYVLIVLSILINDAVVKEILVSQNPLSKDTKHCGSVIQPCKTIKHAVEIAQPLDDILIDSGFNHCFQYILRETINITKSLTLKQYRNYTGSSKPIITYDTRYRLKTIFYITTNFTLTSIQIKASVKIKLHYHTPIFQMKVTGSLMINRCHLYNAEQIIDIKGKGGWNIKMEDCEITNLTFPGYKTKYPNRVNRNTVAFINRCNFLMPADKLPMIITILSVTNGVLIIRSSNFVNTVFSTVTKQVEISTSCTFHSSLLLMDFVEIGSLTNVEFLGSLDIMFSQQVVVRNCPNVTISKCNFINAINGSLFLTSTNMYIKDTKFINNTQKDSSKQLGVLASKNSQLFIDGCSFENNTAPLTYGGTITVQTDEEEFAIRKTSLPSFLNITNSYVKGGKGKNRYSSVVNIPPIYTDTVFHKNVNFSCPTNYYFDYSYNLDKEVPTVSFQFICVQCRTGTYNVIDEAIIKWEKNKFLQKNITCHPCPYEAVCEDGIKSKGNYWGWKSTNDTVEFLPCPSLYCCSSSSTKCTSYDTCVDGRTGVLCGSCIEGHSLLFFGQNKCKYTSMCASSYYFWIFYVILLFVYIIIYMYIKEIITNLKYLASSITFRITSRKQTKANNENEELLREDEDLLTPFVLISHHSEVSPDYVENSSLVSGVIKIIFFFYQISSTIRIKSNLKQQFNIPYIIDILASFFNLKIELNTSSFNICPVSNMNGDIVIVEFIKSAFAIICLLLLAFIMLIYFIKQKMRLRNNTSCVTDSRSYTLIDQNTPYYSKLPFIVRIKCTYVQLLLIGFSSIAVLLFKSVHCVDIGGTSYLYVQGSVVCYNWPQKIFICCIIVWVVPFCVAIYVGCRLMRSCCISPGQFLFMLSFPPSCLWYLVKSNDDSDRYLNYEDALLAKQLLLVVNEPFRYTDDESKIKINWEPVLIFRRLVIVVMTTFVLPPIAKLYPVGLLLAIYAIHHFAIKPYKSVELNMLEGVSLVTLLFLTMLNIFWAFIEEVETKKGDFLTRLGEVLFYVELVIMVFPIMVILTYLIFIIIKSILFKCKRD